VIDRVGQVWTIFNDPFLVIGPPTRWVGNDEGSSHPVIWLDNTLHKRAFVAGTTSSMDKFDTIAESRSAPWESMGGHMTRIL
jgi:hypothetical protein